MNSVAKLVDGNGFQAIGWTPGQNVEKSLEIALKAGCRFVCTDYNNQDEREVGRVLSKWFRENNLKRAELTVSAKLPFIGAHATRVKHFAKKTLQNLRLSYLDLYLISAPVGFNYYNDDTCFPYKNNLIDLDRQTDIISTWKAMELLVDAGIVKALGLCHFNQRQLKIVIRNARIPPVVLQVECHSYFQQRELRKFCEKYEIHMYSPFPFGYESHLYSKWLGVQSNNTEADAVNLKSDPVIRKLSICHNTSPGNILVAFLVQNKVGVIIPGDDTIEILDYTKIRVQLTNQELEAIAELDRGIYGRTFDFKFIFKGFDTHPQNPFYDDLYECINPDFRINNLPRNWH